MTSDYGQFLAKSRHSTDADGEPVFVFDQPVTRGEIVGAEETLGVSLPASFKHFLLTLGAGAWCGATIPPPRELYPFDEDCREMANWITIAFNANGAGDYLAINPTDVEMDGERPVYLCTHDPFGFAKVAKSFEAWSRSVVRVGQSMYESLAVTESRAAVPAASPKKWWQFWR